MCSTVTLLCHDLYQILWGAGGDARSISELLLWAARSAILLVRKDILKVFSCKLNLS